MAAAPSIVVADRAVETTPGLLPEDALPALTAFDVAISDCIIPAVVRRQPSTPALVRLRVGDAPGLDGELEAPGLLRDCVDDVARHTPMPKPYLIKAAWVTYRFSLNVSEEALERWWEPRRAAWQRFCSRVGEHKEAGMSVYPAVTRAVEELAVEEKAPARYPRFLDELRDAGALAVHTSRSPLLRAVLGVPEEAPPDEPDADTALGQVYLAKLAKMAHEVWQVPITCEHLPQDALDLALDDLEWRSGPRLTDVYERRREEVEGPASYLGQRRAILRSTPAASDEEKRALASRLRELWNEHAKARVDECLQLGGYTPTIPPPVICTPDFRRTPPAECTAAPTKLAEPCGNLCRTADHVCEDAATEGCVCPAGQCLANNEDGETGCIPTPAWHGKLLGGAR